MTVYSYTRLIVYDDKFKLHPDILESYEVKEGREFTLKLRAGHKWSDGHPFTTEDFRYFWEDVANNSELSPSGPSVELIVDGQPPKVEIIDERTIRYSWAKPNPHFIESQARAAPLFLFRPAHYLKTLHGKYTPEEEILKLYKGSRWANVFRRQDAMYGNSNVDMPTLNPWVLTTVPPAQRFVFARNPYFHRIDQKGQQLPYIDDVIMTVAATNLIPAKAGLGEADLQPRYLNMRDYTFLQKSAKTSGVNVYLWESGSGSQLALYPNLNGERRGMAQADARRPRFRRALSLAIDREDLNQSVYLGLAKPSNNTIMERSELFKPEYATKWATYDPKPANRLSTRLASPYTVGWFAHAARRPFPRSPAHVYTWFAAYQRRFWPEAATGCNSRYAAQSGVPAQWLRIRSAVTSEGGRRMTAIPLSVQAAAARLHSGELTKRGADDRCLQA